MTKVTLFTVALALISLNFNFVSSEPFPNYVQEGAKRVEDLALFIDYTEKKFSYIQGAELLLAELKKATALAELLQEVGKGKDYKRTEQTKRNMELMVNDNSAKLAHMKQQLLGMQKDINTTETTTRGVKVSEKAEKIQQNLQVLIDDCGGGSLSKVDQGSNLGSQRSVARSQSMHSNANKDDNSRQSTRRSGSFAAKSQAHNNPSFRDGDGSIKNIQYSTISETSSKMSTARGGASQLGRMPTAGLSKARDGITGFASGTNKGTADESTKGFSKGAANESTKGTSIHRGEGTSRKDNESSRMNSQASRTSKIGDTSKNILSKVPDNITKYGGSTIGSRKA